MKNGGIGRIVPAIALAVVATFCVHGQAPERGRITDLEFVNAPVRDILVAIGQAGGTSVVPDETVRGTASFYFADTSFDAALQEIASRFGLVVIRENGVVNVSAVSVTATNDGNLSVDAESVDVAAFLRRLSRVTGKPILFDPLPALSLSYHVRRATLEEILTHLDSRLPDHDVHEVDGAFVFRRRLPGAPPDPRREIDVSRNADRYSVFVGTASFPAVIARLFASAGREYQLLSRSASTINDFSFADRSLPEMLTLLCDQAGATYAVVGDVYYIADAPAQTARARMQTTVRVPLEYLSPTALLDAIPNPIVSDVTLQPGRSDNTISITGTPDAVERAQTLIARIDTLPAGRDYHRFSVEHLDVEVLPSILPAHLIPIPITPLPDGTSFMAFATAGQALELRRFLSEIDRPPRTTAFELSHISVDALLAHLPPSAAPKNIIATNDPNRFFFRGTPRQEEAFRRDLVVVDRTTPQIRYQLLVIQYEDGVSRDFAFDLSNTVAGPDSMQTILGNVGNLLSLNFDVIAAFGYQFAARLNARIADSSARVLVDTTLHALSGQSARFQNTNTYRYRDSILDPQTNDVIATGVIREITSGLTLLIDGRADGSRHVTMDVTATLSKRGTDESDGNPPRTSEKVIDTHVRTASGEAVILSGLMQQEEQSAASRTPLLSRIPVIGLLFQKTDRTVENTELAVYIIPHVVSADSQEADLGTRLMELYTEFGGAHQ